MFRSWEATTTELRRCQKQIEAAFHEVSCKSPKRSPHNRYQFGVKSWNIKHPYVNQMVAKHQSQKNWSSKAAKTKSL